MNHKKVIFRNPFIPVVLFISLLVAGGSGEASEPLTPWVNEFSLGLGVDFATGKYGTHSRTDSVSVPVTLEWRPHKRIDVQLALPYIYQSNSVTPVFSQQRATYGDVAPSGQSSPNNNGQPSQGNNSSTGLQGKQGQASPVGAIVGTGVVLQQAAQNLSQDGVGDMTLQVGFAVLEEQDALPQVRILGYVKFPTGDKDEWLGSGEFDEGVGLSLSKSYGDLSLYIEGTWVFQGGSDYLAESGFTVKNYLSYYAEIGYQATETLVPALGLKGASPSSEERGGSVEGRLKLSWRLTEHTSFQVYAGMGFTTASPDMTAGVSAFYSF